MFVRSCLIFASILIAPLTRAADRAVSYEWFEYVGDDTVFQVPLSEGHYRNPILAGFYPDPSITRAGEKFYLVNSSFTYFPGIPIFESSDLVHWKQLGHVLNRPEQLRFDTLKTSRGVFAPAIHYHNGTFYVLCTLVDSGGNFIVTATDPAGPWSDPVWLPEIDGIDPSLFIDADGKAYVLNNGPPDEKPRYEGHRAIWMQEFDLRARKLGGPRKVILNGGVDISKKPIWIEGPHLFKRGEWYYLMCAEGGTSVNHSEVILRAKAPWGPFEPYKNNPILTQRDLPKERVNPLINAGHADLVEAPDGQWWATFLASRPYDGVNYNTGRETYLLPVTWRDGWPVILPSGTPIPLQALAPRLPNIYPVVPPLTGNLRFRDEFDRAPLDLGWIQVRSPKQQWFEIKGGALVIEPSTEPLDGSFNPTYLARRQQHLTFAATAGMRLPKADDVAAGLAVFQNGDYWYFLGAQRSSGSMQVFLEKKNKTSVRRMAIRTIPAPKNDRVQLKVSAKGRDYSFEFAAGRSDIFEPLIEGDDGSILSTEVAGGFVGTTLGLYARKAAGAR